MSWAGITEISQSSAALGSMTCPEMQRLAVLGAKNAAEIPSWQELDIPFDKGQIEYYGSL